MSEVASPWQPFKDHLGLVLVTQVFALFASGVILDCGEIGRNILLAIILHWILVVVIHVRRRHSPTKLDLVIACAGWLLILPVVMIVSCAVVYSLVA